MVNTVSTIQGTMSLFDSVKSILVLDPNIAGPNEEFKKYWNSRYTTGFNPPIVSH